MDFPGSFLLQPGGGVWTTASPPFTTQLLAESSVANFAAAAWPAANRGIYVPFTVDNTVTAFQMFWENGGVAGTTDIGIYDGVSLKRLVSLTATTNSGATIQIGNITDTTLTPGMYYAGMVASTVTTQTYWSAVCGINDLRACGCLQQAIGSATLPDPMVGAAIASAYLPLIGVAFNATM